MASTGVGKWQTVRSTKTDKDQTKKKEEKAGDKVTRSDFDGSQSAFAVLDADWANRTGKTTVWSWMEQNEEDKVSGDEAVADTKTPQSNGINGNGTVLKQPVSKPAKEPKVPKVKKPKVSINQVASTVSAKRKIDEVQSKYPNDHQAQVTSMHCLCLFKYWLLLRY